MITQEYLKSILNYDSDTGIFTWKVNKSQSKKCGSIAGSKNGHGYLRICINRKQYMSHRLAWLYVNATWPKDYIDHINGNKSDNKICNLRQCSNTENQWNAKLRSDNKTNTKGIYWDKASKRWKSMINFKGKSIFIGYFNCIEDARNKLIEKRLELHNEFANNG